MREICTDKHRVGPWVCEITQGTFTPESSAAIGIMEDGELTAGVMFDRYNKASICIHIASIGKLWLTRKFLNVCGDYAFRQLGVKKVLGFINSSNTKSIRFAEHIGFILESTILDAAPDSDLLIYSLTKDRFKYL